MSAPSPEPRPARIVMTTLLLTQHLSRQDRGAQGELVLYGSSCSQLTQEAEYVKKVPGEAPEPRCSRWNRSPVATTLKETEEQLLLVSRENQVLKIKLEATREAGVQALRSASQKLYENYQARSEQQRKSHEDEKQQIQTHNLQHEAKLRQSSQNSARLAESVRDRCSRIAEMETRVRRMQEEKQTLIEKKTSFEKTLHQMMARNEDSKRCWDVEQQIVTLREQICHLQRLIQAQQHGLRAVIQEAEELNKELKSQDKRIEDLTEKLTALEAQNKELKDRVEFWSGKSKTMVSKGVWTDAPRHSGAFGASPYGMLARLRQQES
ncbi:coiled-coil domain-containing protein 68-like [Patagioenas fasciata]|uniref:coiled-coil domain-containing protein 68-like n=1 Tax=Patagioenas fasciata TaxID=372321 RepID=UPI0032E88996